MILYCADHDVQFDTDYDTETHRWCHDTAGHQFAPLDVGSDVIVKHGISKTEEELLGRRFKITRFTKPHGYVVVSDEHGSWWVHPESLEVVGEA